MKYMISESEKARLESLYQSLLKDERILKMKKYRIHRGSNCYYHTFKVTKKAMNRALHKKNVNMENLLYACVLHDYYLYSRKGDPGRKKGHVKKHPVIAKENAIKDFHINDEVAFAIETHMWPLNFSKFPKTKEARLLSHYDTWVATIEFLVSKKYKEKHQAKDEEYISKLFVE